MGYVLIAGANSDIGKALAKRYAILGFNIYLAARNAESLRTFASDLSIRTESKIKTIEIDILNYKYHKAFYNGLKEKPLIAICVIGYLGNQDKTHKDFEETKKIIDSNYTGVVNLLNIIADDFENKKSGYIIAISSVAGDRGRKSNYMYGSAKAGLTVYLSGLRNRLYKSNVHVLTVKPGYVFTKMTSGMNLPKVLTASPDKVAKDIIYAQKNKKDIIYVKWFWKYIMIIIKAIPEFIFKKMNL